MKDEYVLGRERYPRETLETLAEIKNKKLSIDQIFSMFFDIIVNYIFLTEKNLNKIGEKEYKENIKKELIFYKNTPIDDIFDRRVDRYKKEMNRNYDAFILNVLSQEVTKKELIYRLVSDDLIDQFIDECYQRNLKYIKQSYIKSYQHKWRNQNTLWKLFHQKFNPKKVNFDDMQNSDISDLEEEIKRGPKK